MMQLKLERRLNGNTIVPSTRPSSPARRTANARGAAGRLPELSFLLKPMAQ